MRKLSFWAVASLLLAVGIALTVISCNRHDEPGTRLPNGVTADDILLGPDTRNESITLAAPLALEDGLVLPEGTVVSKDAADPYALNYRLPEGHKVVTKSPGGRYNYEFSGKITCSCTAGTGCSPYVAKIGGSTASGCVMSKTCTQCKQSTSSTSPGMPLAIINFDLGVEYVTNPQAKAATVSPTAGFLDIPAVQEALQQFAKGCQRTNLEEVYKAKHYSQLPENYVIAAVSVFGRLVFVPVDASISTFVASRFTNDYVFGTGSAAAGRTAYDFSSKASCKCDSGTTGCKLGTKSVPLVGSVTYCDAQTCRTCTLITN